MESLSLTDRVPRPHEETSIKIDDLPGDVIYCILDFVDSQSFFALRRVNKAWKHTIHERRDQIIENILEQEYDGTYDGDFFRLWGAINRRAAFRASEAGREDLADMARDLVLELSVSAILETRLVENDEVDFGGLQKQWLPQNVWEAIPWKAPFVRRPEHMIVPFSQFGEESFVHDYKFGEVSWSSYERPQWDEGFGDKVKRAYHQIKNDKLAWLSFLLDFRARYHVAVEAVRSYYYWDDRYVHLIGPLVLKEYTYDIADHVRPSSQPPLLLLRSPWSLAVYGKSDTLTRNHWIKEFGSTDDHPYSTVPWDDQGLEREGRPSSFSPYECLFYMLEEIDNMHPTVRKQNGQRIECELDTHDWRLQTKYSNYLFNPIQARMDEGYQPRRDDIDHGHPINPNWEDVNIKVYSILALLQATRVYLQGTGRYEAPRPELSLAEDPVQPKSCQCAHTCLPLIRIDARNALLTEPQVVSQSAEAHGLVTKLSDRLGMELTSDVPASESKKWPLIDKDIIKRWVGYIEEWRTSGHSYKLEGERAAVYLKKLKNALSPGEKARRFHMKQQEEYLGNVHESDESSDSDKSDGSEDSWESDINRSNPSILPEYFYNDECEKAELGLPLQELSEELFDPEFDGTALRLFL